jgi:hypothetical protein
MLIGFGKFVAWIVGIVSAPYLTALALSAILGLDFTTIILYVVMFYVACFVIFLIYYSLKRYIRKEVYEILKKEKLIKTRKENKNERKRTV